MNGPLSWSMPCAFSAQPIYDRCAAIVQTREPSQKVRYGYLLFRIGFLELYPIMTGGLWNFSILLDEPPRVFVLRNEHGFAYWSVAAEDIAHTLRDQWWPRSPSIPDADDYAEMRLVL